MFSDFSYINTFLTNFLYHDSVDDIYDSSIAKFEAYVPDLSVVLKARSLHHGNSIHSCLSVGLLANLDVIL